MIEGKSQQKLLCFDVNSYLFWLIGLLPLTSRVSVMEPDNSFLLSLIKYFHGAVNLLDPYLMFEQDFIFGR